MTSDDWGDYYIAYRYSISIVNVIDKKRIKPQNLCVVRGAFSKDVRSKGEGRVGTNVDRRGRGRRVGYKLDVHFCTIGHTILTIKELHQVEIFKTSETHNLHFADFAIRTFFIFIYTRYYPAVRGWGVSS